MALKYTAWAYRDNKPYKMTYVIADNKEEAMHQAYEKFFQMKINFDYIVIS